jgi:hypothetical protein
MMDVDLPEFEQTRAYRELIRTEHSRLIAEET